ncbi:MAG: ATP-dependent 6-phosphofructokinase [Candidatus Bathyarchaeota archaeon]|nr:ATP-dependent 6-phosphofructokinase [Candidatus Bathyarchaeota archaeon]
MKTIALVTSGGDAPGMNAAIRAVTRLAYAKGFHVYGFEKGWEGLITNTFHKLTPRSVGGIIHLGGTILRTSRCDAFKTSEGIEKAARTLAENRIASLIVIGGNGSFKGAHALSKKTATQIIGIPATIDNDVFGTNETIGFDTAVNTAVAEIDKIRDTAVSHERIFIVEVMGRTRGFLAAAIGLAVGAETILVPEAEINEAEIVKTVKENTAKGKRSGIIVAAEGVRNTSKLAKTIEKETGAEVRFSILGYAQRGGNPTARSRLLACLFAEKAVELATLGKENSIVGIQDGRITHIKLEESCSREKPSNQQLVALAKALAT